MSCQRGWAVTHLRGVTLTCRYSVLKVLPGGESSLPSFSSKGELKQWSQFAHLGVHKMKISTMKTEEGEANVFVLLLVYTKLLVSGFLRTRLQEEHKVQTIYNNPPLLNAIIFLLVK